MIIIKNNQGTAEFDNKFKVIKSVYIGRFKKDLAIEHINVIIDFYNKNEVRGSIIDFSKGYGSFAKLFDYLAKYYYPVALKSGLIVQAYIVSPDLLSSALGKNLGGLAKNFDINTDVFIDEKKAEGWVKSNL